MIRHPIALVWKIGLISALLPLLGGVSGAETMESLSGLTVLIEVYVYQPANFQVKRVARTSILESLDTYRPDSENWFVRAYKNPAEAFTQPEFRGLVTWGEHEEIAGLVLDGHLELGDEDVERLRGLHKLMLLSLRKTSITDVAMKTLAHMKTLRYLDISETSVSAKGLEELKSLNLKRLACDNTKISSSELDAFLKNQHGKVAVLPGEWSSAWDASRNPEPIHEPLSYFAGATPEEGIPGHLPRGKFPANFNLQLKTLDGQTIDLSSQKGKVIFLNFWLTDSGPCRSELPGLENLYKTLKDQKIFFGYVTSQPAAQVQAALDQQPRNLPVYIVDETTITPYTKDGIPATVIITKKGDRVVQRNSATRWDTPVMITYLTKLINE